MKTSIYSLFDSKAGFYGTPFFMPNRSMALRAFEDLVSDRSTLVCKHPMDFSLFEIGTYDDSNGVVKDFEPVSLGNGGQFVNGSQSDLPLFKSNGLDPRSVAVS